MELIRFLNARIEPLARHGQAQMRPSGGAAGLGSGQHRRRLSLFLLLQLSLPRLRAARRPHGGGLQDENDLDGGRSLRVPFSFRGTPNNKRRIL